MYLRRIPFLYPLRQFLGSHLLLLPLTLSPLRLPLLQRLIAHHYQPLYVYLLLLYLLILSPSPRLLLLLLPEGLRDHIFFLILILSLARLNLLNNNAIIIAFILTEVRVVLLLLLCGW